MALDGVEIITNSSGSHHSLRKLDFRVKLVEMATAKVTRRPLLTRLITFERLFFREAAHMSIRIFAAATAIASTTMAVPWSPSMERLSPNRSSLRFQTL